jgi:hypothetical protein
MILSQDAMPGPSPPRQRDDLRPHILKKHAGNGCTTFAPTSNPLLLAKDQYSWKCATRMLMLSATTSRNTPSSIVFLKALQPRPRESRGQSQALRGSCVISSLMIIMSIITVSI